MPQYGNYGGPGHSGERKTADGLLYIDPDTQKTVPFWEPAIDALDECFKTHDHLYDEAEKNGGSSRDYMMADLILLQDMMMLDPLSLSADAQAYRLQVMSAFALKLLSYDSPKTFYEENVMDAAARAFDTEGNGDRLF